jgi:tetraacyldisaccharide-1-P 4'-kinase
VGKDRWRAGLWATEHLQPDVFVLDDAFQHWGLARDLDLVVLDASAEPGPLRRLPWGRHREGAEALARAHAVLLTRCNQADPQRVEFWRRLAERHLTGNGAVFEAELHGRWLMPLGGGAPVPLPVRPGRAVLLASATASAGSFERTAREAGLEVLTHRRRRDHRRLDAPALDALCEQAVRVGASALVVTEKDAVKLDAVPSGAVPVLALAVELLPRAPEALLDFVSRRLEPALPDAGPGA